MTNSAPLSPEVTATCSDTCEPMKHLGITSGFIRALVKSESIHLLALHGPCGTGKTSVLDASASALNIKLVSIGSYTTPLHLHNSLSQASNQVVVLDDCAGLFNSPAAIATLKAAVWPSAGSQGKRMVKWGSTSEKVMSPCFEFTGKIILITNHVPSNAEMQALLSRSYYYQFELTNDEVTKMLKQAISSKAHYPNSELAKEVVQHIIDNLNNYSPKLVNLRTLSQAYDLAKICPDNWKEMFAAIAPKATVSEIAERLAMANISTVEKAREFMRITGKAERTFYYHFERIKRSTPELVFFDS